MSIISLSVYILWYKTYQIHHFDNMFFLSLILGHKGVISDHTIWYYQWFCIKITYIMIYVVTRYCRIGNDCVVTFLLFSSETITTANIYLIEQSIRKESQITKIMTTQICSDIENNEIFRENIFYSILFW